jgi:hypothetical protein
MLLKQAFLAMSSVFLGSNTKSLQWVLHGVLGGV